jgi:NAD(P)-dependent dehydrogenase (short-subunit alcohol dehydrogenase family)
VTGASAGIGRAYALALVAAGASVVAVARSRGEIQSQAPQPDTLAEVAHAAQGLPGRMHTCVCDLAVERDIVLMVDEAVGNFGRVDVLINNAASNAHHDSLSVTAQAFDMAMNVNVRGPYLAIREVAKHMIRARSGSIINLTSTSANFTAKGHAGHEGLLLYCMSKAALNRLTTYMSEELRPHGIAVNALSPGPVLTRGWAGVDPATVADGRAKGVIKPATPEALGPALVYLAQQTGATLTGQILHADEFGTTWPSPAPTGERPS